MSTKNPLVFLDVCIDGDPVERMIFELYYDTAPKTAENFHALCTGEKGIGKKSGKPLHYKGSFFHRIVKGSMTQGGDFVMRDGSFGESIYGEKFPDESPKHKHDSRGLLSMAIADRNSRGSLFSITFKADHHLDRKNIVFGKLVEGDDILQKIENSGDEEGRPAVIVKIINSGELLVDKMQGKILKVGKDGLSEGITHEIRRNGKHKKSSRDKRKKRKYSSSESDSTSDSESDSSESDSDSDTSSLSESDSSTSSDERYKKRKRSLKRRKHRNAKKREKRRDKKRKKLGKRSKRKSKRASRSYTDSESSSEDNIVEEKQKNGAQKSESKGSPFSEGLAVTATDHKTLEDAVMFEREDNEYPKENGDQLRNSVELVPKLDRPDIVDDHPGKSRSRSFSPKRSESKSTSISSKKSLSRSSKSVSRSPSRSPIRSPVRVTNGKGISRSPVISRSRSKSRSRSVSRSPTGSPAQRSMSLTPPRTSSRSRKAVSRSPVRSSRRSGSSRSSGRAASRRRSLSRSPVRVHSRYNRRSYSRSSSRSRTPDGSSKRVRRGRGLSDRFSYARKYRTPSPPDRSRYGRYQSYRRQRSPPRGRASSRNRMNRSRSPVSRSPIRYRNRRYNNSRSRSPIETSRIRDSPPRTKKHQRRSPSTSISRSPPVRRRRRSSSKERSRSLSESPPPLPAAKKKGLVSYEEGSPDSGKRLGG
ncbi:peptidyl-prolyl cis-trans isomerase CYP95-like isoform X2 [Impatiens glandulifera]|uniref:peptidyl-prolyl cis-trans isomerase CYP95-like isoform X2 n=1 Tax=Impatiens glandulifera TaxID=253017 RepID=UPI001FB13BB1|nr:peptidyl-prolyl cis-trans isomerase CYP95-like isoform X2 [Impatiens glandulifera]